MTDMQSPRGTRDILPDQQPLWDFVRETGKEVAASLGFLPITTPTYEYRSLFDRAIGKGTDVMDKELFLLSSRATDAEEAPYALRPEGTAGIVRSFIEHGMHTWPQPVKLVSFVNCFRYDRPQKGRYREHTQFDVELFGEKGPFSDALIILATYKFLTKLGLPGLVLELNSLGLPEERQAYQTQLVATLSQKKEQLSSDSQARLTSNPLRILDSKDTRDQALLSDIPSLASHFGDVSKAHFAEVQTYLNAWNVPYRLNERLVRGLDYYSHTAFEWKMESSEGQQASLGGGGRYDGLLNQLGGKDIGAVGAGIGLDRVIEAMQQHGITPPQKTKSANFAVILASPDGKVAATQLVQKLLETGAAVTANFDRETIATQLKLASRNQATHAYIVGEQEIQRGIVTIKDLTTGEQHEEPLT